jgi:hypothetical protein
MASSTEQNNNEADAYHVGMFPSSSRSNSRTNPNSLPWPRTYLENCPARLASVRPSMTSVRARATRFGESVSAMVETLQELNSDAMRVK